MTYIPPLFGLTPRIALDTVSRRCSVAITAMILRAISFAVVYFLAAAAFSAEEIPVPAKKGPILGASDATARAVVYANREIKSLDLGLKPFTEKSATAQLVGTTWFWRARVAQGKNDVEVTVVLHTDGSLQSCTSKLLMSATDNSRYR